MLVVWNVYVRKDILIEYTAIRRNILNNFTFILNDFILLSWKISIFKKLKEVMRIHHHNRYEML